MTGGSGGHQSRRTFWGVGWNGEISGGKAARAVRGDVPYPDAARQRHQVKRDRLARLEVTAGRDDSLVRLRTGGRHGKGGGVYLRGDGNRRLARGGLARRHHLQGSRGNVKGNLQLDGVERARAVRLN